jgi:hypothetical protein
MHLGCRQRPGLGEVAQSRVMLIRYRYLKLWRLEHCNLASWSEILQLEVLR